MKKLKLAVHTRYFNLEKPYGADLRIYHLYSNMNADVKIITQKPFNLKTIKKKIKNLEIAISPCLYPFHFLTRLPCCCRFFTLLRESKDSDFVIAEFHPFHAIGIEAFIAAKILNKKLVLDVHDIAGDFLVALYEKIMYKISDMVIATSNEQAEYIKKYNKNVHVVENGVEKFDVPPCKKKKHKKIVGFLGALTKENGVDNLVKAMKNVDAVLYLVGDGPLMNNLRSYVKENGMKDKVIFFGYKPKKDAIKILSCADVLVAPFPKGRQFETNLPLKVLDYLMLKKPIIVSGGKALENFAKLSELIVFTKDFESFLNKLNIPSFSRTIFKKNIDRNHLYPKHLVWNELSRKFMKILIGYIREVKL